MTIILLCYIVLSSYITLCSSIVLRTYNTVKNNTVKNSNIIVPLIEYRMINRNYHDG